MFDDKFSRKEWMVLNNIAEDYLHIVVQSIHVQIYKFLFLFPLGGSIVYATTKMIASTNV